MALSSVIAHTAPYWAAEYDVTYRYFVGPLRTPTSDLRWVRFQMVKEWAGGGVYGKDVSLYVLIERIAEAMAGIESTGTMEGAAELAGLLRFTAEEFQHYASLCEAHQLLTPESAMSMAQMNALADGDRLKQVRNEVREEPRGELVVELSEGGGLALFFAMVDALTRVGAKSELDAKLLEFAQNTLDDEKKHLRQRFRAIRDAGLSDAEWQRVDLGLQKISAEKLRERNNQFGGIFSDTELGAMGRDQAAGQRFVADHLGFLRELIGASTP